MEVIKVSNLTFAYDDANVLKIDSLSVKRGEFVLLAGKSGSGKSTFLKLLKRAQATQGKKSGSVWTIEDGSIAYVGQNPDDQMVSDKVWSEVSFGPENLGWSRDVIRRRVAEIASYFGIEKIWNKELVKLSGGEKQVVNLAAVMVMHPKILLLDEPTAQLDPIAADNFLNMIYKINREFGTTIIISEQRLEKLVPIADRMIVLEDGEVVVDADPTNAIKALRNIRSEMYEAMPTPCKVYYSCDSTARVFANSVPLDIRDGRTWLQKLMEDKSIKPAMLSVFPSKNENIIEIKDGFFKYDENGKDVLSGFKLAIKRAEIHCILGENGSGKTTMLKVLCGMEKMYSGSLNISQKAVISMLPQEVKTVFACDTAREELHEMIEGENAEQSIQEVSQMLDLSSFLDKHPYDLSGGEQQRLALGKLLLRNPDIIIMDEPTKGLDYSFKTRLGELIKKLKALGKTIIIVTHDIEFCALFADRCSILFDGKIICADETRNFFNGNRFYTTSAAKMANGIIEGVLTAEDLNKRIKDNI